MAYSIWFSVGITFYKHRSFWNAGHDHWPVMRVGILYYFRLCQSSDWVGDCVRAVDGAVLLATMVEVSGRRESTTLGFAFAVMDGVGALGAVLAGIAGSYELRYAFAFCALMAVLAMGLTLVHRFSEVGK